MYSPSLCVNNKVADNVALYVVNCKVATIGNDEFIERSCSSSPRLEPRPLLLSVMTHVMYWSPTVAIIRIVKKQYLQWSGVGYKPHYRRKNN